MGHLHYIYITFTGHLQDIFRTLIGHLQDLYRTFTGHLQDIYRTFTDHLQDIYILTDRPVVLSNAIFKITPPEPPRIHQNTPKNSPRSSVETLMSKPSNLSSRTMIYNDVFELVQ